MQNQSTQNQSTKCTTIQTIRIAWPKATGRSRHTPLLGLLLVWLLAACAPPAPAPGEVQSAPTSDAGPQPIVTWYYYDQNNTDPEANERVGNFYLARTIPEFNAQFAGQYEWINVPRDYNLSLDLVAAVQSGGEIPHVMRMTINNMPTFLRNNTVQDLTEYVENADWAADLDPRAIDACRGPDGNIYCVPVSQSPFLVFYWRDHYPNGFPSTPESFFESAASLHTDDIYALTYWGSTAMDGEGAGRYFYQVISSFGGSYDDGAGNMRLNTPENIAAVEFMREIVARGYSPESVFVGSFEEEDSFKQGRAGAFPTGHFAAYLYLNPLTAPDGTAYDTISSADMEAAVEAGQIGIAPFLAPEGLTPGCHNDFFGFVIPNGAPDRAAAEAYIDWTMARENQIEWVLHAGGGLPVAESLRGEAVFQTPFFEQGLAAVEQSDCRPWFGSLTRIPEARRIITQTLFDLVRDDPLADTATSTAIGAALQRAEDEYNSLP